MPVHNHVVIIVDVNAIPKNPLYNQGDILNTSAQSQGDETPEIPEDHPVDLEPPKMYSPEIVDQIKEAVLVQLCHEAVDQKTKAFDFRRVTWTFKLYNSSMEICSNTGRKFWPLNYKSIEEFEKYLHNYTNPSFPPGDKLDKAISQLNKSRQEVNQAQYLSSALKSVLAETQWETPTPTQTLRVHKNKVFAFFRVPKNDKELENFLLDASEVKKDFLSHVLPQAFCQMMKSHRIQLNFVDLSKISSNHQTKPGGSGMEAELGDEPVPYPSSLTRVVSDLNSGRIITADSKMGINAFPLGFPSYITLLKLHMFHTWEKEEQKLKEEKENLLSTLPTLKLKGTWKCTGASGNSQISPTDSYSRKSEMASAEYSRKRKYEEAIGGPPPRRGDRSMSRDAAAMYSPSKSPRVQPTKRIRREEGTMVSGRNQQLLQQRYSDPVPLPAAKRNPQPQPDLRASTGSRGRAMLNEVQKAQQKREAQLKPPPSAQKRADLTPRDRAKALCSMKQRLKLMLSSSRSHDDCSPMDFLAEQIDTFKDMMLLEEYQCLLSCSQAMVGILAKKLIGLKVHNLRSSLEDLLILPFDKLNMNLIQKLSSPDEREVAFRECQLQILLRFEIPFISPVDEKRQGRDNQQLQEEVIRILNLIRAYRKKPPIEDFVNDVLVAGYGDMHGRVLLEISHAVNIPISPLLRKFELDNESNEDFFDQESIASSTHSSICPGDSVSLIGHRSHHHKGISSMTAQHHHQQTTEHQLQTAKHSSSLFMYNDSRKILVPASGKMYSQSTDRPRNVDQKPKLMIRPAKAVRGSPKRVRRNLFDVQTTKDPKDLKLLLALTKCSPFSKPPTRFRSPSSKKSFSPHSPSRMSPFFRAARSRRRLVLDNNDVGTAQQWEPLRHSPAVDDAMMVPESPATPKRQNRNGSVHGSGGTKSFIQESPILLKKLSFVKRPDCEPVNSMSFYSSVGSDSQKSRAWAKSGDKLMAARIKDSVDISSSLILNDLEFLTDSPKSKSGENRRSLSGGD